MFKKVFHIILWCLVGAGCIVLFAAAMKMKNAKTCTDIKVEIRGAHRIAFVSKEDVLQALEQNGITTGKSLEQINLRAVEETLLKNAWIQSAELFVDNNQIFYAVLTERKPIARVFTLEGNSFYIDSNALRLPVIEFKTARVPVFTSFPSDKKILSHPDSVVLNEIKMIANYINNDSFFTAQTAQVNITSQHTYQLIPVLGNQIIELGDANDLDEKLKKLLCFYQQVWSKTGFEKYERIDVRYKGQIVAERRGAPKPWLDTLKAMQQLGKAEMMMNRIIKDTAFASALDKNSTGINLKDSAEKPKMQAAKKNISTSKKTTIHAEQNTKAKKDAKKQEPKAVMKKPG
ncbi:MAG: hypothetical protein ABJA79_02310 [Parafilimonas sp.]